MQVTAKAPKRPYKGHEAVMTEEVITGRDGIHVILTHAHACIHTYIQIYTQTHVLRVCAWVRASPPGAGRHPWNAPDAPFPTVPRPRMQKVVWGEGGPGNPLEPAGSRP